MSIKWTYACGHIPGTGPALSGHESCHSFSYNQQLFALAVAAGRLYKILLVAKAAASRSHRFELL